MGVHWRISRPQREMESTVGESSADLADLAELDTHQPVLYLQSGWKTAASSDEECFWITRTGLKRTATP